MKGRRGQKELAKISERRKNQVAASVRANNPLTPNERGKKRKLDESDGIETCSPSKRTALDTEREECPTLEAVVDPALLADHFAKYIQKWFSKSSPIELENRYLPAKAFLDTTSYDKDRVAANLPDFLVRFSIDGKDQLSTCDQVATPHTLVLTVSGIRTADLMRQLRVFKTQDSKVAKFIAKHMKLEMNVEFLQKNKVGIAIGTPERMYQLMEAGAMKTEALQRIVVDGSYKDEKKNTIFTIGQIFQPMIALLNNDSIRQRYRSEQNKIDILVF
ncbi:uncharacterized protein Z519_03596 [Cladophialophora bantiana CBS 173.52]|uniref:Protein CMS1 n=1 Tax=Cladophialophora bantiana (strain ATCC 10958 / CBS 173.52 / CDC B-1940 / NIH 8579) TaxID=1442370 RepID=A0A0D2GDW8_CLAB1|nr:uncharacterized protein Z519_03596 [Cladophialophora bantiana CBS 173.52]KIW96527.1 hypothetical protein Z519_03596 [Cladophialophora bantiana CBS 173.52]